ncbi:hypothetical protein [Rossellomorea marisflavi]|uniref:hypothetical protein n=1 Tax=Rossellomorea marisflavi TaxID=189381 RepID=UPI0015C438EA|nr:hypothetical protein [Rossellomorea marisflavi]
MVLTVVLIFIAYRLMGKWLKDSMEKLKLKLAEHLNSALSWVMCIVGMVLMVLMVNMM